MIAKRLLQSICVCFVLVFVPIFNLSATDDSLPKISSSVAAFDVFEGDRHGDFQGDITAILSDGSIWKVHPDDQEKISGWAIGDSVHVSLRTSFYWFKREHKFLLCNNDRGDALKAMIVRHAAPSIQVIDTSNVYPTAAMIIEEYHGKDYLGRSIYNEESIPTDFRRDLNFNDGSTWKISDHLYDFDLGEDIYVGYKESKDSNRKFIIAGTEREAIWAWIEPKD